MAEIDNGPTTKPNQVKIAAVVISPVPAKLTPKSTAVPIVRKVMVFAKRRLTTNRPGKATVASERAK